MLSAGFRPAGVFPKQRRIDADLSRDESEHRRRRRLRRVQHAPRMTKRAKLNGEAQPPAPGSHEGQIVGIEHIMAGHFGCIGRDGEQSGSLLKTAGCERACRAPVSGGSSFINSLPFNTILQQDIES
jgi:hypothetical protein